MAFKPVVTGIVGLGGWAAVNGDLLLKATEGETPLVKFLAATSSNPAKHPEALQKMAAKGVQVVPNLAALLAIKELEAVWIPTPIDLHRSMTVAALEAGKAVMCEKPAAGCVDDVDAMIAARDRAKKPVAIGYQDVYDPTTVPAKQALLEGRIGKIKHATVWACWPRNRDYYSRADWAAKFKRNGVWVMDSPANNALAHYVNIPLFLMGPSPLASAQPVAVEAELYRGNPIENYDTISLRLTLDTGATFLALFTHACEETVMPTVVIHGEKGVLTRTNDSVVIEAGGACQTLPRKQGAASAAMVSRFCKLVRGVPDAEVAYSTLESARAQTVGVTAASEAVAIHNIPEGVITTKEWYNAPLRMVAGIEKAFESCVAQNKMLHESGLVKWSKPAGKKDLRGYRTFAGPKGAK
jgi:predicted dehydrogenase